MEGRRLQWIHAQRRAHGGNAGVFIPLLWSGPGGSTICKSEMWFSTKPSWRYRSGSAFTGTKAYTITFHPGDNRYWIESRSEPQLLNEQSANVCLSALRFATYVLGALNATLVEVAQGLHNPRAFETWEAFEARLRANP
jgi:hypothetical protein